VLLADQHRPTSFRLCGWLSGRDEVGVVTTAESFDAALALTSGEDPDVALVSAGFGPGRGLSLAYRLKHLTPPAPVLIYAEAVDPRLAGAAMVADADGVFDSRVDAAGLVGIVVVGERVFPALVPSPFAELARSVAEEDRRILAMLLLGDHPDDIADSLGISARLFRMRRETMVRRLDAVAGFRAPRGRNTRRDAAAFAPSWATPALLTAAARDGLH
jgi:DNA-binding NarL/FixJ family response regulator